MENPTSNSSLKISNQVFFQMIGMDLRLGKSVKFNVVGNSMLPFLKDADQVVVKQPQIVKLKIGDILLANHKGQYILHRLIKIHNDQYYLAGDGNLDQLEKVNVKDVLAVVMKGFREGEELRINTKVSKTLGLVWYYFRPLRFLFNKF